MPRTLPAINVSLPKLADLIQRDTVIAGKVLGIANSALYSRGRQIYSINEAVPRLGIHRLRNAVLGLSVNQVWSKLQVPYYFSMLRFNQHALATAIASDLLAERLNLDAAAAFTAGLFHDVGQLLLTTSFPSEYSFLLSDPPLDGEELDAVERRVFGGGHGDFSADAIAYWNLPADIGTAVRFHETPSRDETPGFHLSAVVHAADRLVSALGLSVVDCPSRENAAE